MRAVEPFRIQCLYRFEIPLENRCIAKFGDKYECWRRYRVDLLASLKPSYLNQLKEKRPLQHGAIVATTPELMKDLVPAWRELLLVA